MLPLLIESWIWYGFATTITLLRFVARIIHFGHPRHLQWDDYIMMFALAFYTTVVVTMNIVSQTSSNLFPDDWWATHSLTPKEISDRVYGSKLILVVEQSQIVTIWLIKACLLVMYHRITVGSFRKQNIAVIVLMVYVAFSFVFMEIFYFAVWCRPFHDYWAVPTPHVQCATALNHLITNAVFNLTSDLAMLFIALPMFIRSNLPLRRKLVLSLVFSLGIFVIVAAVLNKYYSFTQPFGSQWTYWYIRESSTAMIVANLPFTWPLVRRAFGATSFLGESATEKHDSHYNEYSGHKNSKSHPAMQSRRSSKGKLGLLSRAVTERRGSEALHSNRTPNKADIEKGSHAAPSSSAAGSGGVDSNHAILGKEDALCFGLLDDEDFEDTLLEEDEQNKTSPTPPAKFRDSVSKSRWGSVAGLESDTARPRHGSAAQNARGAADGDADVPDVPPLPAFGAGVDLADDPTTTTSEDADSHIDTPRRPKPVLDKAVLSPSRHGDDDEPVSPLS